MRIVIVGQQAFGKAVLEAFLARGDEIAGVFAAPETAGRRPDPLVAAAEEKELPVYRFAKYSDREAQQALAELERRYRRDGLCSAVRAARVLRHPETRDDPVPPVAAAAASRAGLDPVGDHPRPQRDRADDLPPDPGARRGAGDPAEAGRDRSGRHRRLALFRQDLPARGRGAGAGGRSGRRRARHRMDAGREPGHLRGLGARGRIADQLGQPRRFRL